MKSVYVDCSPFMERLLTADIRALVPDIHINVGDPDPAQLKELVTDATVVLNGHTFMKRDLLEKCSALKSIVYLGTGASSFIDIPAAAELGIAVRVIRNFGDRTVAEHAFALMLIAARNIARMDRELRSGKWDTLSGIELDGKVLGVIGTGGIGSEMVRIADRFGMKVLAWNRSGVSKDLPCRACEIDDILRQSDVVSLHLSLNDDTRGLIDRRRIGLLRPTAIVVNTARAAILDESALVDALRTNRIAHAALDVFLAEPLPSDHPFTRMDNVTLAAHSGFKTEEASHRLLARGFDLLRKDLELLASRMPLPA